MDVDRQLGPVPQTQAAQGHRDVPFDRRPTQLQPLSDLGIGQPLRDELGNGVLPGGQWPAEGLLLVLPRPPSAI